MAEEVDGGVVIPGAAVDPRRDERVVDVAHREDSGLEGDLAGHQAAWVPGAVEPLVVVVDEGLYERVEAAELPQELDPCGRVPGDRGELVAGQRGRLLEHRIGDYELPDVVEEAAGREAPQPPGGKPELLADLDRKQRDAAGVLLGRAVLLGEGHEQRADVRAEERLFRGDEVGAAKITPQRPRPLRRPSAQVERDRDPHGRDPRDLEPVPEPPAEVPEVVISAPTSAAPSHTMPTATARSSGRRVRRYVRIAL